MKKDLNIIEKEVRRCYPNATEEEVARLVREWTAKAKGMNEPDFSLMQFPNDTGLMRFATQLDMDWENQMARAEKALRERRTAGVLKMC